MTQFQKAAQIAIICILLVACSGRPDSVAVRTWDTYEDAEHFPPELRDPSLAVPWLQNRPSFGIAFSGGGTRSATATLGQLRALDGLGWIDRARYISANSGGTWTTLPFTYLSAARSEERFLGPYVPPEELNAATLKIDDPDPQAMSTAIHGAGIAKNALALRHGDESYAEIVGSIFLEPFGLDDGDRLFTFHRPALEQALLGNPRLSTKDFYFVEREDRPYLIMVGTMLATQRSDDVGDYFPLEISPLYTGIRERFVVEKDGQQVVIGGGYVESFGYDSYEPSGSRLDNRKEVRLRGRIDRGDNPVSDRYLFSLADAMGISSAAPLVTLTRYQIPNLVFPELRHWAIDREAIARASSEVRREADEFQHGDGADLDNLALMPLLVRRVKNILVFVNTSVPFEPPAEGCDAISSRSLSRDLLSLFRVTDRWTHNVVIADGDRELTALCTKFREMKALGQPLVHCQPYEVAANRRYGIESYRPRICWVYLDRAGDWLASISDAEGLNRKLLSREPPFNRFPHYSTFAEQGALLIDLDRERVSALSNLTAWTVYESSALIRESLEEAGLPRS